MLPWGFKAKLTIQCCASITGCEQSGVRTSAVWQKSGACYAAAGPALLQCLLRFQHLISISIEAEQTFAAQPLTRNDDKPLTPLSLTMIYTDTDSGKTPIKSSDRDEAPPQEQVSQYRTRSI